MKKILVGIIIIIICVGSYISLVGVGDIKPLKEELQYGLDINGGVYVVMEAQTDLTGSELADVMNETRNVISNRVNQLGLSESTVTIEGTNRIRVELPGVKDGSEAIDVIGQTAELEFLLADNSVVLNGSMVSDAYASLEDGEYVINIEFNRQGADKFKEATERAYSGEVISQNDGISNKAIMIVLDGEIISAPVVNTVIPDGKCFIEGMFTKESAETLSALIRGGALPTPLVEVNSSIQTATIGEDALNKSITAGAIGLALVFAVMIIFYKVLGLVANITLCLYVLLVAWAMALLGNVLTLPGIAGIILSIGMAVDANIIIFAKIKDEILTGKTVRVSVNRGFKSALNTVLDAQITTLIAAVVLYQIGTTSVKGFAITLMIGIITSIFTAVVVTQLFVSVLGNSKRLGTPKAFGVKVRENIEPVQKKEINFIKNRKKYILVSISILLVGLISFVVRGFNYGIDFTGGTMLQIHMNQRVEISEVETSIETYDLNPTIIHAGEGQEQIIIKTIRSLDNNERTEIINTLSKDFGISEEDVLAVEQFGPSIGEELQQNAFISIIIASIGMLIYIIFRFKSWMYGVAAISGIVHDVLMVLAWYAILNVPLNNPFIAGILTVVGYSINDTIVVFDKIRENKTLNKKLSNETNINKSINQTLKRSIITSLTTLVVMIPLYLMVSTSIREFVLPLMIGVCVGAYSSIFICSPLFYDLVSNAKRNKYLTKEK